MSGPFQLSGPFQSEPEYRASLKSGLLPVKLGWFQRWFLKHSQQAWHNSQAQSNIIGSYQSGALAPAIGHTASINTRNSIDMSLVRADGGWIVQFQKYDQVHDNTAVNHYVIPDTEDFGQRLSEIITLQCMR